jgi:hypothetical protein
MHGSLWAVESAMDGLYLNKRRGIWSSNCGRWLKNKWCRRLTGERRGQRWCHCRRQWLARVASSSAYGARFLWNLCQNVEERMMVLIGYSSRSASGGTSRRWRWHLTLTWAWWGGPLVVDSHRGRVQDIHCVLTVIVEVTTVPEMLQNGTTVMG